MKKGGFEKGDNALDLRVEKDKLVGIKILMWFSISISVLLSIITVLVYINAFSVRYAFSIIIFGCLSSVFSTILILNKKYNLARFILVAIPPYSLIITSVIIKAEGFNSNVYTFLVPKIFAIMYLMAPIVFFGLRKKKYMIISFLILMPTVLFYDYFNRINGVFINELLYDHKYYPLFVGVISIFFSFILMSLLAHERNSKTYELKIKKQNKKIETELSEIKTLNSELEYQSNLYQILNLASNKKPLLFILQDVLEEILTIENLKIEEKGLIFLANTDGNLEIAAHKNVDALLGLCSLIKKGQCLCGEVLESKQKMFCNSVGHNHTIVPEGMTPHGHYVIPIIDNDLVLGMINIYIKQGEKQDENIEMFLEAVAKVLARKISSNKAEEKVKLKNIELDYSQKQIEKTSLELKETYKELDESISYAEFMQKSLIPNKSTLDRFFEQSGVLFKPKDRVSGDFYFAHDMGDFLFFGVADCTGHGIPGSFLAAMSTEAVKYLIESNKGQKPNLILEELRVVAKERFSINFDDKRSDSMDASMCMYDRKADVLYFSGGFSDLIIIRDGKELIEIKGTKCPVGSYPIEPVFELHEVKIQKNDVIYLTTDGFVDQFGHIEGREKPAKFKKKRFRELLLRINHLDCNTQVEILESTLKEWRGDLEQIDDVTVFIAKH